MNFSLNTITLSASGYNTPATYQVCASECYLFVQPSFESEKVEIDGQPVVLEHGQELSVHVEGERFSYVEVKDDIFGYVFNYYICSNEGQDIYPSFNGFVRTEGAVIFDMQFENSGYTAHSGQEIFIYDGYHSTEIYTAVQIVLDDGALYNGYLLTADIEPKGISSSLIVGITIIVAVVTIILSLLFIKKKKKKKSGSQN